MSFVIRIGQISGWGKSFLSIKPDTWPINEKVEINLRAVKLDDSRPARTLHAAGGWGAVVSEVETISYNRKTFLEMSENDSMFNPEHTYGARTTLFAMFKGISGSHFQERDYELKFVFGLNDAEWSEGWIIYIGLNYAFYN